MSDQFEYVDFEDLDDFALPDHIEFNNDQPEEFCLDALDATFGY